MNPLPTTVSDGAKATNAEPVRLGRDRLGHSKLQEPISYALLSPGKRLRSLPALKTAVLIALSEEPVLQTAFAVEFVHASSLVSDDRPCVDNSKTRRGQPCLHLAYDENTAILAALSLRVEAFPLVAADCRAAGLSPDETDQALE